MMNTTGHWSVVLIKVGDRDSLKLRAMTVKGRRGEGGSELHLVLGGAAATTDNTQNSRHPFSLNFGQFLTGGVLCPVLLGN